MLYLKNITKTYSCKNKELVVIDHLTMEVAKGDFVAMVGPSGCGKSTLLLMLGGMLTPTEGEVSVDGVSLYCLTANERAEFRKKNIGFLFQTFHLIPYLTAEQNVKLPLLLSGCSEKEQNEKAEKLLKRVGLSDRMDHKPSELSVGQQQRVALARTLANDPALVLADEPTGNLDPEMSKQVISFLKELHEEGRTIVLVTHDQKIAKETKRTVTFKSSPAT